MDQSAKTSLPVELDTSPKADVNIDEDLPPPETAVTSNFRETVGNVAGVAHNNQTASSNFEHDEIIVTPSVAVTNNARAAFQTKQPSASTSMEIIPVSNKKPSAGKTQISANSTRCCGFF